MGCAWNVGLTSVSLVWRKLHSFSAPDVNLITTFLMDYVRNVLINVKPVRTIYFVQLVHLGIFFKFQLPRKKLGNVSLALKKIFVLNVLIPPVNVRLVFLGTSFWI